MRSRGRARASRPSTSGARASPALRRREARRRGALPRRRAIRRRRRGNPRRRRRRRSPSRQSRSPSVRSARRRTRARVCGLEIELDRDRLLADRAVRADGEDDARVALEVRSGRHAEPVGRLAQVAQLNAARSCELRQLGVLGDELVQAALDVEPCCDARLQKVAPRGREATSLGRDARRSRRSARTEAHRRPSRRSGSPRALPRPLRVEDRHDRIGPVADDPAHRLAVVRVVREALAEDEDAPRAAHADRDTPRPGSSDGTCTPSTSSTPGHGSSRRSRFPSRST